MIQPATADQPSTSFSNTSARLDDHSKAQLDFLQRYFKDRLDSPVSRSVLIRRALDCYCRGLDQVITHSRHEDDPQAVSEQENHEAFKLRLLESPRPVPKRVPEMIVDEDGKPMKWNQGVGLPTESGWGLAMNRHWDCGTDDEPNVLYIRRPSV